MLLLVSFDISAQSFNAAPYFSFGNTGVALEGLYSLSTNPAGIGGVTSVTIGTAYQQHFMTSDLRSQGIYLAVPLASFGALGVHWRNYGVRDVSSLSTLSLSYVKRLGRVFQTSISANHHQYAVEGFRAERSLSADLGLQMLLGSMTVGLFYRNVTQSAFARDIEERLPQELGLGVAYAFSEAVTWSLDVVREFPSAFDLRTGVQYAFDRRFRFRGGASGFPVQYFAGFGLWFDRMEVDLASSFHQRLGSSPQIALSYAF